MTAAFLLVAMYCVAKPQAAQVAREPATAQRILFDPKEPDASVPKMRDGENAIIEARFDAHCTFTHDVISTSSREVTVRLLAAKITLSMNNRIYLPTDVRQALRTHEEGHRVISERIYEKEAEMIALEVADAVLGKSWTATDADRAIESAANEFRYHYRAQIARRVAAVNERYDELTKHGRNEDITVIDAIEQAFVSAEMRVGAATRPSTTNQVAAENDQPEDRR